MNQKKTKKTADILEKNIKHIPSSTPRRMWPLLSLFFCCFFPTFGGPLDHWTETHNLQVIGALWYDRVHWEETERPIARAKTPGIG